MDGVPDIAAGFPLLLAAPIFSGGLRGPKCSRATFSTSHTYNLIISPFAQNFYYNFLGSEPKRPVISTISGSWVGSGHERA